MGSNDKKLRETINSAKNPNVRCQSEINMSKVQNNNINNGSSISMMK